MYGGRLSHLTVMQIPPCWLAFFIMLAVSHLLSMRIFRAKSRKSFKFEITFQLVCFHSG